MKCDCIIEHLIKSSFGARSFEQKKEIIRNGRPCPKLSNLSVLYKDKNRCFTRHFTETNYSKTEWLAGCTDVNKLFCWPCLLFSRDKSVWSTVGFSDLNNLWKAVSTHEKTRNHISCFYKLKTFGDSSNSINLQLDHQRGLEISRHNEQVRKNRHILSCLIDTICFLAKQELAFHEHNEAEDSLINGNYVELLKHTAKYDIQLEKYLNSSAVFREKSLQIQNDLIITISSFMNDIIKDEIKNAKFVSILLDETSNVASKSQLSTCVRYVDDSGEVQERFLKFSDVSSDKTAETFFKLMEHDISDYGMSDKIIALSYDGAPVVSAGVGGLQTLVKRKYPEALFVHCCSHDLNLVLQQSVIDIKQCGIFFASLSGISSFFLKSSKRRNAVNEFMNKEFPRLTSSLLVNTIKHHRENLIEFFEHITDNSNEWDSETLLQARASIFFLNSFETCFLLEVFSSVFSHTNILFDILQKKNSDIAYCSKKIEYVKSVIKNMHQNGFSDLWQRVSEISCERPSKRRNEDAEFAHRSLFHEILDTIYMQLTDRFGNYMSLQFTALLDTCRFPEMNDKFPETAFNSLLRTYRRHFDLVRLRNELIVLYCTPDRQILNKPLKNVLKFMMVKNLHGVMPEIHNLLHLLLTMPATTVSVEHSFSTLKRIKTYVRSTQGQERLTGLAMLSIEKELLQKLRQNPKFKFKECVIEKFCSKSQRLDFTFR